MPELAPGGSAAVAVAVATLWTDPSAPRPGVDDPALAAPVDPAAWNANLCDDETRGALLPLLETQALYGAEVLVDELRGAWARVVVTGQATTRDDRGYPGWVPAAQLVADPEFVDRARRAPAALVTADRAELTVLEAPRGTVPAPPELGFTTVLPIAGDDPDGGGVTVALPGGGTGTLRSRDVEMRRADEGTSPTAAEVLADGRRFLGLQYLWAGMTSWGFDCSGFSRALLLRHGVTIPRDAGDQMRASGLPPVERADLRPGDLVFFSDGPGSVGIRHVAVWAGEGRILHSPNYTRTVTEETLDGYDVRGEYAGAVRPLP